MYWLVVTKLTGSGSHPLASWNKLVVSTSHQKGRRRFLRISQTCLTGFPISSVCCMLFSRCLLRAVNDRDTSPHPVTVGLERFLIMQFCILRNWITEGPTEVVCSIEGSAPCDRKPFPTRHNYSIEPLWNVWKLRDRCWLSQSTRHFRPIAIYLWPSSVVISKSTWHGDLQYIYTLTMGKWQGQKWHIPIVL